MTDDFTRCHGHPGEGSPHDFCGYQPADSAPDRTPLMFCERCGEVRALALPPQEALVTYTGTPGVVTVSTGAANTTYTTNHEETP